MPGRGPAPKSRDERSSTAKPVRGEWVDLEPLTKPVLPALPKRSRGEGPWSSRSKNLWAAWRKDPATGVYGVAEVAMAIEAIYLHEEMVRNPIPPRAAEVRQWMDRLALNLKGKRDLRLRSPQETVAVKASERTRSKDRYGDLVVLPGGQAVGE